MPGEQIHAEKHYSREEAPADTDIDMPVVESSVDRDSTDKLLDEIDSLLEPNAEEFVQNYQQRGGE